MVRSMAMLMALAVFGLVSGSVAQPSPFMPVPGAPGEVAPAPATRPGAAIDEAAARKLAIGQYNTLFADKFYFSPVDKKHHAFPELPATYFNKVEFKDGRWVLAGDPPAGVMVYAEVSADGQWVQVTRVGFAPA